MFSVFFLPIELIVSRRTVLLCLVVYLLVASAIVWAMVEMRRRVIARLDNPSAREQWRQWKEEVAKQNDNEEVPVKRRVPRGDEPPALVMLRDHFPAVLGGVLVVATFLLGFLAFLLRGIFSSRAKAKAPTA